MCGWKSLAVAAILSSTVMAAQEYDPYYAIAEFTGNMSPEEMDAGDAERLEDYLSRPLKINMVNHSRLRESGLLTHYQIVSLIDYRNRHGDILSLTELSAVDGFSQDFVRRLAPFISLSSSRAAGHTVSALKRVYQEADLKAGVKANEGTKGSYALRYRIETGESVQASIALSQSYGSERPDAVTGNLLWQFKRHPSKLVAGDFNARFGQGLALWNGMGISGYVKPSSFLKRSATVSPSGSFTGNYAFRGLAMESLFGRFRLAAMAAITDSADGPGFLPGANLSWLWRNGQAGLTHYLQYSSLSSGSVIEDMKTSFDLAFTVRGVDVFSEFAYDWMARSAAVLAGAVFPAGDDISMAAMLRYYPSAFNPAYSSAVRSLTKCSNEYASSFSAEFTSGAWLKKNGAEGFGANVRRLEGAFCADAAYFPESKSDDGTESFQIKSLLELKIMPSGAVGMSLRVNERFRTWGKPFRTDIRMEVFTYSRYFDGTFRANAVRCDGLSFLVYAEGCLKKGSLKAYLRSGVFCADSWDDRIYAYERDVPGSFNVPAFYGRGVWASLTGYWRFARWGRVYARLSVTEYPFNEKKKPGKAELKLMLKIEI